MDAKQPPVPAEVEAAIARALAELPAEEASYVVASIANRAASALQKLSRSKAEEKRGTPEWGRWARLQNASRDAVLRTATCREVARDVASRQG